MEKSAELRLQILAGHVISTQISGSDLNQNHVSASTTISGPPVIIGGMVLDIHAKPSIGLDTLPRTTIPGTVKYVSGGVARNIAECVSKLGRKPFMVSVVGSDMAGEMLLKYWESAELSTEGILKIPGGTTPVVANTFDSRGELITGVASVEAVEKYVTPGYIWKFRHIISSTPVLMLDANLHPQSLDTATKLAAEYKVPVFFEPVSVVKSARIKYIAEYVTITSPNEDELVAMASALSQNEEIHTMRQNLSKIRKQSIDSVFNFLKPAIRILLENGIKLLIVTLGASGAFVCFKKETIDFVKRPLNNNRVSRYDFVDGTLTLPEWYTRLMTPVERFSSSGVYSFHLPALHASVLSLTGAGDCLVGGILASICNGMDIMQSLAMGIAVGKVAVETETNVPFEFDLNEVAAGAQKIISNARQLMLD